MSELSNTSASISTDWEQTLVNSVLDMVHAADGDFVKIAQLLQASTDATSSQFMIEHLSGHPQGRQAFTDRFSLGAIDLHQLHQLPKHTLGHLYAEHMLANQLKPLQAAPAQTAPEFLITHITETHDIWHVVTGCSTDILGEIQLEAFYVAQLAATRFWLALLVKNLLKSLVYDIASSTAYMEALTQGWQMGRSAAPLFGVDWRSLWSTKIEDVRSTFNIQV